MLNALPHPIQVVIRGVPATTLPVLERIKAHGSPQAEDLAAWLGAHLHGAQLVERERYLVVPAPDLETLGDRCASLEASMRRIGLPMERIAECGGLRDALGGFLTPRRRQFGPAVVDVSGSGHLVVDGELARAFDLGKLPPAIVSDWAAPLLDGDLPMDVDRSRAAGPAMGEIAVGRAQECARVVVADARPSGRARADRGAQDGLRAAPDAANAHGHHGGRARTGQNRPGAP